LHPKPERAALPAYPITTLASESISLVVHITQARVLDELLSQRYRHHAASAEFLREQLLLLQTPRALL